MPPDRSPGGAEEAEAEADSSTPETNQAVLGEPAAVVEWAEEAWEAGEWTRVRNLLEPLVLDPKRLRDPIVREKALTYLADATLNDDTLDPLVGRQLARNYLDRLLDADADYRMPDGIYSPELAALFREVLENRDRAESARCEVELNACRADLAQRNREHQALQTEHEALQQAHGEQEVEVRTQVKRSRAWALIPLGVGHFYNGDTWLGVGFLLGELTVGAAGLGLLIRRNVECTRTDGFNPGSLRCTGGTRDEFRRRRAAEEVMGWMLLGTVALDIVLAQILFRSTETTSVERIKRRELGSGSDGGVEGRPRSNKRRAKVRAAPTVLPGGAGLGIDVRY